MKILFFVAALAVVGVGCIALALGGPSLKVGDTAPSFKLKDEMGAWVSSADLYAHKKIVLFFYPKSASWSVHCRKEACSLRDSATVFARKGIVVAGINYESPETHTGFKKTNALPFMLLSDTDYSVAKAFGTYSFWSPVPKRITYLIDGGIVKAILKDVDPSGHAAQVLDVFEK